MTTPTLLDAAKATADALEEVEGHVGAYLWEKHGYAETVAQARAAIAREEERQKVIEGLVEAARVTGGWFQGDNNNARPNVLIRALARYDAIKEDDRG